MTGLRNTGAITPFGWESLGPLSYGDITPPSINDYTSATFDDFVLNCVFDQVDCPMVLANPTLRPNLGTQCISFGIP
jgi:hypothetical protein